MMSRESLCEALVYQFFSPLRSEHWRSDAVFQAYVIGGCNAQLGVLHALDYIDGADLRFWMCTQLPRATMPTR